MAQELYDGDGKKLITYPRAEARYLTENQISDVPAIVAALTGANDDVFDTTGDVNVASGHISAVGTASQPS